MAKPGDTYFNPVTRTKLVFVTTAESSGGMTLAMDWFVPAGERLAAIPHCHSGPDGIGIEHFDLLEGSAACSIAGRRQEAKAPFTFTVPCNTPHIHPWNTGSTTLHVRQRITPPEPSFDILAGVERFFETLTALSQQGRANRRGDIFNPLQASLLLTSSLFPVTYVAYLPVAMQGAALGGMSRLARRLGYPEHLMPTPA